MNNKCKTLIDNGLYLRYVITLLLLYTLSQNLNNKIIKQNLYLILAVTLTILDLVDTFFTKLNSKKCTKTLHYQLHDKICDSVSYFLLLLLFKFDGLLLFLILYRITGVLLFYFTEDSNYIILFFDFIKEYLLYLFIFGNNYTYIPILMVCKIGFEYYFHKVHNRSAYKKENIIIKYNG